MKYATIFTIIESVDIGIHMNDMNLLSTELEDIVDFINSQVLYEFGAFTEGKPLNEWNKLLNEYHETSYKYERYCDVVDECDDYNDPSAGLLLDNKFAEKAKSAEKLVIWFLDKFDEKF